MPSGRGRKGEGLAPGGRFIVFFFLLGFENTSEKIEPLASLSRVLKASSRGAGGCLLLEELFALAALEFSAPRGAEELEGRSFEFSAAGATRLLMIGRRLVKFLDTESTTATTNALLEGARL